MKYAWAAYKKGALAPMGEAFTQEMNADEFKRLFEEYVVSNHHAAWTLIAKTARGMIPVGFVLAAWAPNAPFMIVNGACWFPWATARNIIETSVGFFDRIRKEMGLMFYALPEHRQVYDICARHGVIRRVGTSFVAFQGKVSAVFETIPDDYKSRKEAA